MENLIAQIQMTTLSIVVLTIILKMLDVVFALGPKMDSVIEFIVAFAILTGFIATLVRIWVY